MARDGRGTGVGVPLTSRTASIGVRRTTRYQAPRRRWPPSEGRSRAHCEVVAIGPPTASSFTNALRRDEKEHPRGGGGGRGTTPGPHSPQHPLKQRTPPPPPPPPPQTPPQKC